MFDSTLDTIEISESVGRKGKNLPDDVIWVKMLLNRAMPVSVPQLPVDENCDGATIVAIESYQRSVMGLQASDGKVDPHGKTIKSLRQVNRAVAPLTWSVPVSSLGEVNRGLEHPTNAFMEAHLFGKPRETFSQEDQDVTNPKLKKHIGYENVGRFSVPGLRPALASLKSIMADIKAEQPEVYAILGHSGMLVCRYVRGSSKFISNHSWGTAIDLKLNKIRDKRGDNRVQYGLTLIAPIFNRHEWCWGSDFNNEDAMHFEASKSLILAWEKKLK